jgi:GNAT superfamily N-acetyltransferase
MTTESPRFLIRVADEADIAAIACLRSLWIGHGVSDPAFERRMAGWLAEENDHRTIWLASVGDLPVGMVSLFEYRRMPKPGHDDSRWGYVGNMFVRDGFRNRGLGSALLAALIAAADERSYARLVVSPSADALSLYTGGGFIVAGETGDSDVLLVRPGRKRG